MVSDIPRPSQRSLSDPAGTIRGRSQAIVSLARISPSPLACCDKKNQTGAPAMVSRLHLCRTISIRIVPAKFQIQTWAHALSAANFFGSL
jgi:hypothetical protein